MQHFPENRRGRGVSRVRKTNNPMEHQRKRGGQPGNSNARKSGLHTAEIRAFTTRVRNWKRRVRETLKFVEEKLALRRFLTSPNAGRSA